MDNEEKIKNILEELEKHNLTFDEYLLYKAVHTFEHKDDEIFTKLQSK